MRAQRSAWFPYYSNVERVCPNMQHSLLFPAAAQSASGGLSLPKNALILQKKHPFWPVVIKTIWLVKEIGTHKHISYHYLKIYNVSSEKN